MALSMSSSSPSTMRNSTMSDIAGISLSVDKYGDESAHVLTFYKNKTDAVIIGRRSSASSKPSSDEHDRALFRCPVISRRHAKITFTQYGNVYISDLASHHGTHILRPGETVAKPVPSNHPTVLADGDTLTFGKPVGKDASLVRPVTARVRLLFSIPSTSSTAATASVPAAQSTTPTAVTAALHPGPSGRYGMYTPAMTSSGSDSSSEEEIEEISPPPPQLPPCSSFPTMHWGWPNTSWQFHPHSYNPPLMQHPHHMHRASPVQPSRPGRLSLLRRILPRLGSVEEISSHRGSTRLSPISISSRSRSSSVVEIPRPEVMNSSIDEVGITDTALGSPRLSRATSPVDDAGEDMDLESEAPSEYSSRPANWSIHVAIDAANEVPNDSMSILIASDRICTPEPVSPAREESDDFSDMYATPAPVAVTQELGRDDLASWFDSTFLSGHPETPKRTTVPPSEEQFTSRVESLKSKLADLEQRMRDVPEQGPSEDPTFSAPEPAAESSEKTHDNRVSEGIAQDFSASEMLNNLKDMLQALDELRKKAEVDMAKELEAIRAARTEAEAALAAARLSAASPEKAQETATASESPATTLKRKRNELESEDNDNTPVVVCPTSCQVLFDKIAVEPPRKRQRSEPSVRVAVAKRIVAGVAKTTAIATVGAVAAWSVLAFS